MKKYFILFLCLISFPVYSGTNPYIAGSTQSASTTIGLFYSNFNDATNDAYFTTALPTGWDDDYATSPAPLEGAESLLTDTTAWDVHIGAYTTQSSGTTYARMSFRVKDAPTVDDSYNVFIGLTDTGTDEAYCVILYDIGTNKFFALRAFDDTTFNGQSFTTPTSLNDATYFLYLTYTRGTSVVCTVTDSGGTPLVGGTSTLSTANASSTNRVNISNGNGGATVILDQVEVRSDTNWGTP